MRSSGINWFYIFIGLLFATMLFVSARFFKGSGDSSVGITQSREHKINSEKASLVKTVHVVPGQQVKAGDLLIELTSQELEIQIDKLVNRIAVLKSEQKEKAKLTDSKIAFIKAESGIAIEELESDIVKIRSELKMNKELTSQFTSLDTTTNPQEPEKLRIGSLDQQKSRHRQAMDIRIKDILQEASTDQSQLINQIKLQERELELLYDERKHLSKFSLSEGVVENIFVKAGEQVEAFTGLLSVNPVHPTTVVAYLVGKKSDFFTVGAQVTVSSYDHRSVTSVQGKVIGFGSVNELPAILQKSTAVKAFGREVFIEIAPDNNLANGEKVLIR
jgi:HlyD family secretion protein